MPELHSPSKQYDSQGSPSSDPVFVRGSERKFAALRKFQVGSVVQGEPVAFRQSGANYPCLVSGFRIKWLHTRGKVLSRWRESIHLILNHNGPYEPSAQRGRRDHWHIRWQLHCSGIRPV